MADEKKIATLVYLEPELRERLERLAEKNGRSVSQEGRIAVRDYCDAA